jgi:hypothetical protein
VGVGLAELVQEGAHDVGVELGAGAVA